MKLSVTLFILTISSSCFAQNRDAEFDKLAGRYFDEVVFRYDPVQGTYAGFHQYDTELPAGTRAEIQAQVTALRQFESQVQAFDPRGLSPSIAADRELVLSQIRGTLLSLETIRAWEKNPDSYSSGVTMRSS